MCRGVMSCGVVHECVYACERACTYVLVMFAMRVCMYACFCHACSGERRMCLIDVMPCTHECIYAGHVGM